MYKFPAVHQWPSIDKTNILILIWLKWYRLLSLSVTKWWHKNDFCVSWHRITISLSHCLIPTAFKPNVIKKTITSVIRFHFHIYLIFLTVYLNETSNRTMTMCMMVYIFVSHVLSRGSRWQVICISRMTTSN